MEIVNKVAESDIEVFNLAELWDNHPVVSLDVEPFLVEGLILREKVFRDHVKAHDWSGYAGRHVAVHCSADAIVPTWAYMLVAAKLHGVARSVAFGTPQDLIRDHFIRALEAMDWSRYDDALVVIKGCGNQVVPQAAYLVATQKLQGVARKLMYGEPCSSVPLWRRPAAKAEARPAAAVKPTLPVK
jgi:hypothetical protein